MSVILKEKAKEEGAYIVQLSFYDEAEQPVVPTSVHYTLTDAQGNVINSLEAVEITPAEQVDIVLSGADLSIDDNGITRILDIKARYNSDYGNDLPLNEQIVFYIEDFINIGA